MMNDFNDHLGNMHFWHDYLGINNPNLQLCVSKNIEQYSKESLQRLVQKSPWNVDAEKVMNLAKDSIDTSSVYSKQIQREDDLKKQLLAETIDYDCKVQDSIPTIEIITFAEKVMNHDLSDMQKDILRKLIGDKPKDGKLQALMISIENHVQKLREEMFNKGINFRK